MFVAQARDVLLFGLLANILAWRVETIVPVCLAWRFLTGFFLGQLPQILELIGQLLCVWVEGVLFIVDVFLVFVVCRRSFFVRAPFGVLRIHTRGGTGGESYASLVGLVIRLGEKQGLAFFLVLLVVMRWPRRPGIDIKVLILVEIVVQVVCIAVLVVF